MSKDYITAKEDYRLIIEKEWIERAEGWRIALTREIVGQGESTTEMYLSDTELEILIAALSR